MFHSKMKMPPNCNKCYKFVNRVTDGLCCVSCTKAFHRKCTNLTQQELKDIENKGFKDVVWKCESCNKDNRRSKLFNSAMKNSSQSSSSSSYHSTALKLPPQTLQKQFKNLLKEFQQLKRITLSEIHELKQEIIQLKLSQISTDDQPQQINSVPPSPVEGVTNTDHFLEIRGLSLDLNRSPFETAFMVANAIGCSLSSSEVTCTTPADNSHINIKFICPKKREDFLMAGKSFNRFNSRLVIERKEFKIFINEKLTDEIKKLLFKSKRLALANGFKFAWIVNGKVLIKRSERDIPIVVQNEQHLNMLFYTHCKSEV